MAYLSIQKLLTNRNMNLCKDPAQMLPRAKAVSVANILKTEIYKRNRWVEGLVLTA